MPSYLPILKMRDFLPRRQFLHVARAVFTPDSDRRMHAHADFAEVFWIERGPGFHLVNGQRIDLATGDLIMVRRRDHHGFAAAANHQLVFVNVAFSDQVLALLRRRYFAGRPFPWQGGALPTMVRLSETTRQRLSQWADSFSPAAQSRLELEGFLIDLLRIVTDQPSRFTGSTLPAWLTDALTQLRQNRQLSIGVPALASLTGRSREHINRTIRRALGRTTTDVLNDLRMDHAAHQLRMTNRTITQIAFDCGLSNLAHFYRIFRTRHHTTPRHYRLRERALLP